MYQNNGYNIYKTNSVNYASKEQLLLMLVDGSVKFAKRAEIALNNKDIKGSHENLVRVQDIFFELMSTLDQSAGEWAVQMFKVYEYINSRLYEANIKKDVNILLEVMPLIEDVRDTWHEAYRRSKSKSVG